MQITEALTFDDLLLVPSYSEITPNLVSTKTYLTRDIQLNTPFISAAMDSVTESRMAISMARNGGVGVIHKNFSIEHQVMEIRKVKKSESGMINNPITISPEDTIKFALDIMADFKVSGLPVVIGENLVGILTNRDVRFVTDYENSKVKNYMTRENLVTVTEGISIDDAKILMHQYRVEKLLVVDKFNSQKLKGMITIKDINKDIKYPHSCRDKENRLIVGAAIGALDNEARVDALIKAEADFLVLDSAHGHSRNIIDAVIKIKNKYPKCQLIAGNVATYEGARALFEAGADTVKVGIGPGSTCTTRIISGVGVPQITAISEAAKAAREFNRHIIADGGIKFSGDAIKALAVGASTVMIGSMFAGTDESPGETTIFQGITYKTYRGIGSLDAMKCGSSERYFQDTKTTKFIPEGVVSRVPLKGPVCDILFQMRGGLKSGMSYIGASTIKEIQQKAKFIKISAAGLKESHVHDVVVSKEAPNYKS